MNTILKTLFAAWFATMAAACALLSPFDGEQDVKRAGRAALAAYEALQQAALIYGRLQPCAPEAPRVVICREGSVWRRIKESEARATAALTQAIAVFEGARDEGEVARALEAIEAMRDAIGSAQRSLPGGAP